MKDYAPKLDNNPDWAEEYRLAGRDWADKEAAATILEDTKSAVMAKMQLEHGDIPVNRAEQKVKSSLEWEEHIKTIVEARRVANIARVDLEALRMEFSVWNNREANARAELKHL